MAITQYIRAQAVIIYIAFTLQTLSEQQVSMTSAEPRLEKRLVLPCCAATFDCGAPHKLLSRRSSETPVALLKQLVFG